MELVNHPGMFLNGEAAASLERFERDHGVQPISDAGRTVQEQQNYIDRWDRGGAANRPPNLYEPKRPAWLSDHVVNNGQAIDTPNWRYWRNEALDYGWVVDYDWDVVHFRYDRNRDKFYNRPAFDNAKPIETKKEDEHMKLINSNDLGTALIGAGYYNSLTPDAAAAWAKVVGPPVELTRGEFEQVRASSVWSDPTYVTATTSAD